MSRCQEAISPSPPSFPGRSGRAGGALPNAPHPGHPTGRRWQSPQSAIAPHQAASVGMGMATRPATSRGGGNLLPLSLGREQRLVLARHEPAGPHGPEVLLRPLQAPCEACRQTQLSAKQPCGRSTWVLRAFRQGMPCMGSSARTPSSPAFTPSLLGISPVWCPGAMSQPHAVPARIPALGCPFPCLHTDVPRGWRGLLPSPAPRSPEHPAGTACMTAIDLRDHNFTPC